MCVIMMEVLVDVVVLWCVCVSEMMKEMMCVWVRVVCVWCGMMNV